MSRVRALPPTLAANPRLDRWVAFEPDGTVTVRTGKVEIGQGIVSALAQIAAEELDVAYTRIRMAPADTVASPDEGSTSGSRSIEESGASLRQACAEVRDLLLQAAARRLGASLEGLAVEDGVVRARDGGAVSYWTLAHEVDLAREATGEAAPKAPEALGLVGRPLARLDIPAKIAGAAFIHDLELPGMLHGRILRPPAYGAQLLALDEAPVRAIAGLRALVREGSFLGVVAEREEQAIRARAALARAARWSPGRALPDEASMPDYLRAQPAEVEVLLERGTGAEVAAGRRLEATYTRPYLAHAAIGPSCAIAWWREGRLEVWSHSQAIYALRAELAKVLELEPSCVIVRHAEGAGCYGHNGADDVALDAALLARAVPGCPVRVQWMRDDEFAWEPYGPAMVVRLRAELDAAGAVARWEQHIWGNRHITRPGRHPSPGLLAAWHLGRGAEPPPPVDMPLAMGGGSQRNAVPYYAFAAARVVNHAVTAVPLRVSTLRALGAHLNVFAIECFMDELAHAAGADPVAFRLRHLEDRRARAVLAAAAERAGWQPGALRGQGRGFGIGFARYKNIGDYVAVVAEVRVEEALRVERLVAAVDCGRVVNPDGVANQMEGGAIQAASWTLKEQVRFDRERIRTRDWNDYPILTFEEAPAVEVVLLDRPEAPSLGVGEGMMGPTAAAIGNALYHALGVRVRDLPLTPERIAAAIHAQ
ncbi:MAG TPA: molybdopterin cofactor-binding domain-containing protein [Burkholderiales bacterium]|nr:molybdopterin cofactor-binding domain-containing protein [Burkholderiales bacterium]